MFFLYCTILSFYKPKEGIWKHFGKKEKVLVTGIFSFSPAMFLMIYPQIPSKAQ